MKTLILNAVAGSIALALSAGVNAAVDDPLTQTYYVPLPEDQVEATLGTLSLDGIETPPGSGESHR